jgi:hypothetical protein
MWWSKILAYFPQAASSIKYFHWFCNNCLGMQVMMSVLLHRGDGGKGRKELFVNFRIRKIR